MSPDYVKTILRGLGKIIFTRLKVGACPYIPTCACKTERRKIDDAWPGEKRAWEGEEGGEPEAKEEARERSQEGQADSCAEERRKRH